MELNHKMLRENADPDCKVCKGSGYRWIDSNKQEFGESILRIGSQTVKANSIKISDKIKVLCPLCFGPDGKPRSKERVKK